MNIKLETKNGLIVSAILVNAGQGIAYCQDRLVRVRRVEGFEYHYEELKSIDVIPILEKEDMWN